MGSNVKNAMDLTRLNTIKIWHGVTKPISRSISSNLKSPKENFACIASNIWIAKAIWTVIYAHSGNTGLIIIDTTRNLKSSKKLKLTQSAYP